MKPKISVVIPVYNTEKFLRKCLDSVVNQTFKDIEIICVDDCSPDGSYKIVEEYKKKDSRITFIQHEKNLGQGGARNTGIKLAKADFIASVDSDDCIAFDMLEKLWIASNEGEYDITCCGYKRVSEKGQIISESSYEPKTVDSVDHEINIFTFLNPAIWNKLWRKSLFIENDIFFPDKLYFQDMATIPLLLACAKNIKIIDQCLYYYLVREGSVTNSYSPKHIIDYFKVYEILYNFLIKKDLITSYADNLASYINSGMKFHSENVLNSEMNDKSKSQYLRHLLMMKLAFFESFDSMSRKNDEELFTLLSTSTSFSDFVDANTIFGIKPSFSKKLNIIQLFGIKTFGFLFRPFILNKQMIKLENDPVAFFKDSKVKFTQLVGRILRLI